MTALQHALEIGAIVLGVWLALGFIAALWVGPVLRDRSASYPPVDGDV